MVRIPRLVVAAPGSGHGKTTVATGLMAALAAKGLAVSAHKAGPDYIDPSYHALATGRPGRNLDPVLCGEELIGPLFAHGAAGADVAVVEGVMGLFDGRAATPEGSTAQVARLLAAPVVLVVDVTGQGRSVAALVSGFRGFDPGIGLAGVILNRAGSARHVEVVAGALAGIGMPVLGALPRDDTLTVPSRHLGLVPAAERPAAAGPLVARLAAAVAGSVDLDRVLSVASSAPALAVEPWDPAGALAKAAHAGALAGGAGALAGGAEAAGQAGAVTRGGDGSRFPLAGTGRRPVVAVAGGPAFSFAYPETAELLTAAGAEVVPVDPLRDEALPPGTSALLLGGGFPEEHAPALAANSQLRAAVAGLAGAGAPVVAECGGLLYLAGDLDGQPMCGVIGGSARMTGQLTLGYRDAVAATDSVLASAGTPVRGHEFHRTTVSPAGPAAPAWRFGERTEGFVRGRVHASYLHLHWAGYPWLAHRLVRAAAGTGGRPSGEAGQAGRLDEPGGRMSREAG
jgi:cobyrinic acid a,c-diamide synthase